MLSFRERLEGGLFGLLIGDALGVPYEFHAPEALPPLADIEMTPPGLFPRAHARVPPATWSDDGAQALILLASLLDHAALDVQDFGNRLVEWYQHGYMAVDQDVFDVGIQTSQAIRNMIAGAPAARAGSADEHANGNGSLMRVLPLALWHRGSDSALVEDAHRQSSVTHGHARAQVCCALYCLWARQILHNVDDPWRNAVQALRDIYGRESQELAELEWAIRPDDPPEGRGSGYVVDSLRSARWALQAGGFEQAVKAAISLGHDTDTTACIAGGIAGIRDGIGAIPQRWRAQLRGTELVEPLLGRLQQWHGIQD
jgi:ADP-ribosyl-[dinitrogen reductase] hydrolase